MASARARARWIVSAAMVLVALAVGLVLAPVAHDDAPPPVASYPASWLEYAPADGAFHVMAPGPATERQGPTEAGTLHRADFAAPGGGTWSVEWLDVAPEVSAGRTPADLVDLALGPLADRLGAQIDEEDILRQGSYPGVELHLSSADGRAYLVRVLAEPGRLVEASATLAPGSSTADGQRFVDSLALDPA